MFRSFVYLDEEKMYTYLRQIDKEFATLPTEINTKRTRGGNLSVSSISINAEKEVEERRSINKDVFNDYDRFEKDLEKLEASEYFDFALNAEYDLKTVPKMSIIRVNGRIEIPE